MNSITTEFDRLLSRYGPPIKPPIPLWKRKLLHKPGMSTAHPAKTLPAKKRNSNALTFREPK